MNVRFFAPAETELKDAVSFYNKQSEGLGFEFVAEVKKTIERIVQHPQAWAQISQRTRRCRTNRFPYGIIYQRRDETILIVAVMHLNREPGVWQAR